MFRNQIVFKFSIKTSKKLEKLMLKEWDKNYSHLILIYIIKRMMVLLEKFNLNHLQNNNYKI